MRKLGMAWGIGAVLCAGSFAALAKLPPPSAQTDADKAAAAEKAKLAVAKEAELLGKYQDASVANYKKNKGVVDKPVPAAKNKAPNK